MFKAGEIVKLNSGGHPMTILSVSRRGVKCTWAVRGDIKEKTFPAIALTKPDELEKLIARVNAEAAKLPPQERRR
ncbi:MAG TPA: DUF2158 domain-containing protein [Candidatus Dormibacteraeota bacterium]|nr:DUF2158 domain-containing protein [Candidatus Dormibacteraeota bacterium]